MEKNNRSMECYFATTEECYFAITDIWVRSPLPSPRKNAHQQGYWSWGVQQYWSAVVQGWRPANAQGYPSAVCKDTYQWLCKDSDQQVFKVNADGCAKIVSGFCRRILITGVHQHWWSGVQGYRSDICTRVQSSGAQKYWWVGVQGYGVNGLHGYSSAGVQGYKLDTAAAAACHLFRDNKRDAAGTYCLHRTHFLPCVCWSTCVVHLLMTNLLLHTWHSVQTKLDWPITFCVSAADVPRYPDQSHLMTIPCCCCCCQTSYAAAAVAAVVMPP